MSLRIRPFSMHFVYLWLTLFWVLNVAGVESERGAQDDQLSLGLSLGPEVITVAQVFENKSSGLIVRLEGSKSYQIWFADTARQKKITRSVCYNYSKNKCLLTRIRDVSHNILVQNLRNVQSATNAVLKAPVRIPAVALPGEIRREKTRAMIAEAMSEIDFADKGSLRFVEMKNAVHYTYDLGNPQQLGLESCDWEIGVYEVVVVDYNAAYFGLYLIDIKENRGLQRAHATFSRLGEHQIREDRLAVSGTSTYALDDP